MSKFARVEPGYCITCGGLLSDIDKQDELDSHSNLWECINRLTAQRNEMEEYRDSESRWAQHYLDKFEEANRDAFEQRARADNAERVLAQYADPQNWSDNVAHYWIGEGYGGADLAQIYFKDQEESND